MGIFDEAIREHLDLKRRHGADPAEVDRLEREALGPVRRGPEEPESLGPGSEADLGYYDDSDAPASSDYRPESGWENFEDDDRTPPSKRESGRADGSWASDKPPDSTDPDERRISSTHQADRTPDSQPRLDPSVPETAEFDVERALAADSAKSDEDVLEETPEFLQDAPDHDRLWFEQRPPRDFDFDG